MRDAAWPAKPQHIAPSRHWLGRVLHVRADMTSCANTPPAPRAPPPTAICVDRTLVGGGDICHLWQSRRKGLAIGDRFRGSTRRAKTAQRAEEKYIKCAILLLPPLSWFKINFPAWTNYHDFKPKNVFAESPPPFRFPLLPYFPGEGRPLYFT